MDADDLLELLEEVGSPELVSWLCGKVHDLLVWTVRRCMASCRW